MLKHVSSYCTFFTKVIPSLPLFLNTFTTCNCIHTWLRLNGHTYMGYPDSKQDFQNKSISGIFSVYWLELTGGRPQLYWDNPKLNDLVLLDLKQPPSTPESLSLLPQSHICKIVLKCLQNSPFKGKQAQTSNSKVEPSHKTDWTSQQVVHNNSWFCNTV